MSRQYTWIDDKGKKIRLAAPQYIDYVMTYAQRTVNDDSIFPTKFGNYTRYLLDNLHNKSQIIKAIV